MWNKVHVQREERTLFLQKVKWPKNDVHWTLRRNTRGSSLQEHRWYSPRWQQMPLDTPLGCGFSCYSTTREQSAMPAIWGKTSVLHKALCYNPVMIVRWLGWGSWSVGRPRYENTVTAWKADSFPAAAGGLKSRRTGFKASARRLLCKGRLSLPCENFTACGSK